MGLSGRREAWHFETVSLGPGMVCRYLPENKWKTLSVDVLCKVPVQRETVTRLAMVPRLAKRGTADLPTLRHVAARLEELYGAAMGAETTKVGPIQVVRFGMDLPSPAFLHLGGGTDSYLEQALSFIWDVATRPYLENGCYPSDRFEVERDEQKRAIKSIMNNRPRYAMVRLVEEISKGDPSGLPAWGLIEDLDIIGPRDTWDTWVNAVSSCPITIYAVGDGSEQVAEILCRKGLQFPGHRECSRSGDRIRPPQPPCDVVRVEEFLPGEQTIVCMAFYLGIREDDPLMPALMFYDGILGGFAHSKLFRVIREKESLAYFADTSPNTWRGLVVAMAGVDDALRGRVEELVIAQVEAMKRGDISDDEMENTRIGLLRRYLSESDCQASIVRRSLTQEILGGPASEEELVAAIKAVTRDIVVEVSNRANLVGVYTLRAKDEE